MKGAMERIKRIKERIKGTGVGITILH